ncbi:MAG: hypothetical protein AUG51_11020 [Acidobacteria bacterium 13_1_20CM_3_53_8]|nr:MAG: hypothetical protein AUG51_11020 [Acidobacteria bacterium 13_1_20CM_3_53_8]
MKLPFEFGIKLIFRLVIPGFFLSLGFIPLLRTILDLTGWGDKFEYIFAILVIFMGWLIIISDMLIYMWFEGRRFWPGWLRRAFIRLEERRLKGIKENMRADKTPECEQQKRQIERIKEKIANLRPDKQPSVALLKSKKRLEASLAAAGNMADEAYFDIRNFPIEDDDYVVKFPTQLGNLMNAYEDHSWRVYGMDSVFYWYRIWLKVDKDLREELDDRQALVDSTVYTSFALYFTAFVWLISALFTYLHLFIKNYLPSVESYLPAARVTIYQHLPRLSNLWLLFALFLILGYAVYRLSIRLSAQYGEHFKSLFDVYWKEINVDDTVDKVVAATCKAPLERELKRDEKFKIAYYYLQFNVYLCPHCGGYLKPGEAAKHNCTVT